MITPFALHGTRPRRCCPAAWEAQRHLPYTSSLDRGMAVDDGHYPVMAGFHTLWLFACLVEASMSPVPNLTLSVVALVFPAAGQTRLLAMATLGERWTTRIIILPGHEPVTGGIFRFIRHPNYLGVFFEIAALPLVFGCFKTAIAFTIANLILMLVRIPAEERAPERAGGYQQAFKPIDLSPSLDHDEPKDIQDAIAQILARLRHQA